MRLYTWREVDAIVETFLYYPLPEPQGVPWFNQTTNVYIGEHAGVTY